MNEKKVLFKGILGGLQVQVHPETDLTQLLEEIQVKLYSSKSFFDGTEINLVFSGRNFTQIEKHEIINYVSREINVDSIEFLGLNAKDKAIKEKPYRADEGMTRFFQGIVRSGQRIDYDGNVVIIGDINPGGEVVARGNIVILGTLRGMAHAGSAGDANAIVVAFCLQPTQLRIGSIIARPPEDDVDKPSYPEIAYIKGSDLIIEPYLPGRGR